VFINSIYHGNTPNNISYLKLEASDFPATLAPIYKTTRRHIPAVRILNLTCSAGDLNGGTRQKHLVCDRSHHEQMCLLSRRHSRQNVENHGISFRNFYHHLRFTTLFLISKLSLRKGRAVTTGKPSELLKSSFFFCFKNSFSHYSPPPTFLFFVLKVNDQIINVFFLI
jgi:hypothetical protein